MIGNEFEGMSKAIIEGMYRGSNGGIRRSQII